MYPIGQPGADPSGHEGGFDNWDLAAAAIGTATSKSVPVTIDTIQYYNRIAAPDGRRRSWDYAPTLPRQRPPTVRQFVDYRDFSYTRSEVFQGCTTWLDVPTLRWKFDDILDRVDFADLPPVASGGTVTNVAGFAQLADDVRAVIDYLHNNEVVVNPGDR